MRYLQRAVVGLIFVAIAQLAFAQAGDFETRKGVEYATHDGAKLAGDLYLPKAAGPHPAIVAIHGGGWQIGGPFGYQYWGPYLASRGYGVFAISYRLSKPGRRRSPRHCTTCAPRSSTSKAEPASCASTPNASA